MKGVLRLLGSLILNVANVMIIASRLCYAGMRERNHKIDITGSGCFTFDYYNSVPYETTPSDPKLALIYLTVSLFARMGKRMLLNTLGIRL